MLLNHVMRLASDAGVRLQAEFLPTGRNRMMYLTYMMAGFRELGRADGATLLEAALDHIQPPPSYLTVETG